MYLGSASMYIFLIHYCVRLNTTWILRMILDEGIFFNILMVLIIVSITTIWLLFIELNKRRKLRIP